MKRSILSLLVLLLLISCLTLSVCAEHTYVADSGMILSESQEDDLDRLAASLAQRHNVGLYIITTEDYQRESGFAYLGDYVDLLYHSAGLGLGEGRNGIVLAISTAERDYNVYWYGSRAEAGITSRNIDQFESRFLDAFRNNNYYLGFLDYLNACDEFLTAAENDAPIGRAPIALSAVPGILVALLTGIFTSAPMRSAKQKTDANEYIAESGLTLNRRSDMFLTRSVSRRPRNTGNSSGGGVHHHSSGGHSHGGKF